MSIGFQKVKELHHVLPIGQIAQTLESGIAADIHLTKKSNVDETIYSFVRLFFNGNNPLLKVMLQEREDICVLRVRKEVLNAPQTLIADSNTYESNCNYYALEEGFLHLNFAVLNQKQGWTDSKLSVAQNGIRAKQRTASLLVPNCVRSCAITGIYVASGKARELLKQYFNEELPVPVIVHPNLFFNKELPGPLFRKEKEERAVGENFEWPDLDEEVDNVFINFSPTKENHSESTEILSELGEDFGEEKVSGEDGSPFEAGSSEEGAKNSEATTLKRLRSSSNSDETEKRAGKKPRNHFSSSSSTY